MKRVSFKVAKAIKVAGYPQYGNCDEYYNQEGHVVSKFCDINKLIYPAPTYLEAWLWLWKSKNIYITFSNFGSGVVAYCTNGKSIFKYSGNNPEEAIISAIEYLVDNDLIK